MVTYLVGTDGESASKAIADHLETKVGSDDMVKVVYATHTADQDAQAAVSLVEDRLESITSVTGEVLTMDRGDGPVSALLEQADELGADMLVIGLRRHSRTERIIMGSISHALIEQSTIPVTLVPLPEYQTPAG